MTVKELIEELKQFDEELLVVCQGEEFDEPYPHIVQYEFDTNYWSGSDLLPLKKNAGFVVI